MSSKITIQKGNPYTATITVTNKSGTAYNLTDKKVFFTIKSRDDHKQDDKSAILKKDITIHTNASAGITTLSLTASDTVIDLGTYKSDFRVYASSGTQLNTVTILCDVVDIVTKRTDYIS